MGPLDGTRLLPKRSIVERTLGLADAVSRTPQRGVLYFFLLKTSMHTKMSAARIPISAVHRCLLILAAILLVATAGCALPHAAGEPQRVTAAEYEIYSAVLDSLYAHAFTDEYAVEDSTSDTVLRGLADVILSKMDASPAFPAEIRSSYIANNASPQMLAVSGFAASKPVVVLPDPSESQQYVTFSRAGFANSGDEAVVHVLHYCGGRCGGGKLVRLVRLHGEWSIQEERRTVRV